MNLTITLSDLPAELTNYAFDEFEREVRVNLDEFIRIFEEDEKGDNIAMDYERQELTLTDTYLARLIAGSMMSHVTNINSEDPSTLRSAIDDAFRFTLVYDLSELPAEVTDYAFDQYRDRIFGPERETAEERVFANESVELNYDDQRIDIRETIVTAVLRGAMEEKIRDIEREVELGERDDYTYEDVRQMRSDVDRVFDA